MQFRFEVLAQNHGQLWLKCFYGPGPDYAEFFIYLDLVNGVGDFTPKDSIYAEVLSQAFASAMTIL